MHPALRILTLLFGLVAPLAGWSGGNTFEMKVVPFVEPEPPGPEETLIYVLREDTAFGAARKFAIIDNDTVMSVLTAGTFSHFKVPSGEHEIVAYMSPSPIMHYRVMPAPGKTVYLLCKVGYTTGMFMVVIKEEEARALMQRFKYTEIGIKDQKAKMDYKAYYDTLYN